MRVRVTIPEGTRNRWSRWNGREGERVDGGVDFGGSRPVAIPPEFLETVDDAPDEDVADENEEDSE